jgi:hypothetical protein
MSPRRLRGEKLVTAVWLAHRKRPPLKALPGALRVLRLVDSHQPASIREQRDEYLLVFDSDQQRPRQLR